jgi:hypothetical protein
MSGATCLTGCRLPSRGAQSTPKSSILTATATAVTPKIHRSSVALSWDASPRRSQW